MVSVITLAVDISTLPRGVDRVFPNAATHNSFRTDFVSATAKAELFSPVI